jgi:hypothetical protein
MTKRDRTTAKAAQARHTPGAAQRVQPETGDEVRAGPGDAGRSDRPEALERPSDLARRQARASRFFWGVGAVLAVLIVLFLLL